MSESSKTRLDSVMLGVTKSLGIVSCKSRVVSTCMSYWSEKFTVSETKSCQWAVGNLKVVVDGRLLWMGRSLDGEVVVQEGVGDGIERRSDHLLVESEGDSGRTPH